ISIIHAPRYSPILLALFCFTIPPPPTSTLFPYTTLFRSHYPAPTAGSNSAAMSSTRMEAQQRAGIGASRRFRSRVPGKKHPRLRSEEHTSELQSRGHLVCRLLLEKKEPICFGLRCV